MDTTCPKFDPLPHPLSPYKQGEMMNSLRKMKAYNGFMGEVMWQCENPQKSLERDSLLEQIRAIESRLPFESIAASALKEELSRLRTTLAKLESH